MTPTPTIRRWLLAGALLLFGTSATSAQDAGQPEEIDALIQRMEQQLQRMNAAAEQRDEALRFLEEQVEAATRQLDTSESTEESLKEQASSLSSTVATLAEERSTLESQLQEAEERNRLIAELDQRVTSLNEMLSSVEGQRATLEDQLAAARAQAASNERQADSLAGTLGEREDELTAARDQVARLTNLLTRTADQLKRVEGALGESEARVVTQQETISNLGQRLNIALAERVEELEQYRSEFFGRLRRVLGDRPDIRIEGDRFVLQSELLFDSGSARLDPNGVQQLEQLATTLKEVASKIPEDVDWVLRVDGHTDRVPINRDSEFDSNWELSTARAISVVEFLIRQGIPPQRLAATGFGEFQPIDPGSDEIAYRRNRRIEFKLTES